MISASCSKLSEWLHGSGYGRRSGLRWLLAVTMVSLSVPAWALEARDAYVVGNRIVAAVESVRPNAGAGHWTVSIAPNPIANAHFEQGGHIIVNTGLLRTLDTDNQLAFLIGHEATHLLNHDGLRTRMFRLRHPNDRQAFLAFRKQEESQADRGGVMLMARAGYDPRASIFALMRISRAWHSDLFAPHLDYPSGSRRIARLLDAMPRAMWLYTHRNQSLSFEPVPVIRTSPCHSNQSLSFEPVPVIRSDAVGIPAGRIARAVDSGNPDAERRIKPDTQMSGFAFWREGGVGAVPRYLTTYHSVRK